MNERDNGRRPELHAAFYGLLLRSRGYTPEETAELVIERYPWAKWKLAPLDRRNAANRD